MGHCCSGTGPGVHPPCIVPPLPTDGPEAGAPAAVVPHPQNAALAGAADAPCPPGTMWPSGAPRQGLWHLCRLQEHLQRAGWQRLPRPGSKQPQTCRGGLPCTVSPPCLQWLFCPSLLTHAGVSLLLSRHGGIPGALGTWICLRPSRAAELPTALCACWVSGVKRCFCPYGTIHRDFTAVGVATPCRSVKHRCRELLWGRVAAPPKCLGVTLAPALHHPAKGTSRSSSDSSFLASWIKCPLTNTK